MDDSDLSRLARRELPDVPQPEATDAMRAELADVPSTQLTPLSGAALARAAKAPPGPSRQQRA
jgi:hypothetical protein